MLWCIEREHRVARGTIQVTGRSLGLCAGEGLWQGLDSVKAMGPAATEWRREDRRKGKIGWLWGQDGT